MVVRYLKAMTKNRTPAHDELVARAMRRIPNKFLPLFERAPTSDDSLDDDDDESRARRTVFITESAEDRATETPEYDFEYEQFYPNGRAALTALKCALRNPLCAPHADRLISELHYLRLTASAEHRRAAASDARESTRASRRAESNAMSASDDEKLERLEDTLSALKTRVAALACLNRETTNAGSE